MSRLANLSCRRVIQAFQNAGFYEERRRGSHVIMVRDADDLTIVVPCKKEIAVGTLRSIIRQSGMTVEEFLELL
jgi:predicted RNA binding protein YcfA (HicA-like mRNA interferase family)